MELYAFPLSLDPGLYFKVIRFYQKYLSGQVIVMFLSPSPWGAKKENKTYKNLNTKSRSHCQLFETEFGVHELC